MINVRTEVSNETNASAHYVAQALGITVREVYGLIPRFFFTLHTLDDAVKILGIYKKTINAEDLRIKADPESVED